MVLLCFARVNTLHNYQIIGASPAPAGTAGLRFFTLDLPNEEARRAVVARIAAAGLAYTEAVPAVVVRDPWKNTILLQVGSAPDARAAMALTAASRWTRFGVMDTCLISERNAGDGARE